MKRLIYLTTIIMCACTGRPDICNVTSEDALRRHVEFLASDSCDGREPFTEGADRAVNYISEQMREIGLIPLSGEDYLQMVPLVKQSIRISEIMQVSTAGGPLSLHHLEDFTAFNQLLDNEVEIDNAKLVFAGYGIVAPEYGKNDYRGLKNPENKVAIVIVNDPGLGTEGDYFSGDAMTYYGRWTYKYEEGARQGLKGVLIIHNDRGAGYPWSTVCAGESLKFALNEPSANSNFALNGWLTGTAARKLLNKCGYDFDKLVELARRPDFKPIDLSAKLSVSMENSFSYAESPNVVGYIRGSDESGECIVCSAHWDHLGHSAVPVEGDNIINGASDNATGLAWLLETARAFKKVGHRPKRSIVFIAPTCEEKGMWGTEFYVRHPLFPIEKTVAVINMDVIPLWGENNDVTVTGYGYSNLDSILAATASKYGRYVMADPDASNGMFYRSDQLPFMRLGVPALFAKGWSDSRANGSEWSAARQKEYWSAVYHKPCDQTSPADSYDGLIQDVNLFFDLIREIADTDFRPTWSAKSEFQR